MSRAEHRFEQIEQYLRGQMPAGEAAAFEAEINADPDLAEQVQQHRLERQGLELLVERDLFAQMQAWDREITLQQTMQPKRAVVRPINILFRAAAIAAVFVTAFFGWWLLRDSGSGASETTPTVVQTEPKNKTKNPVISKPKPAKPAGPQNAPFKKNETETGVAVQEPARKPETPAPLEEMPQNETVDYAALAGEYYRERDFIPPVGSKSGSGSASYDQALDSYRNGQYGNVITQLKPILNLGPDALSRQELLGHTYYKNRQFDAAYEQFRDIAASRKQPYAQRAEWAMALTLLQQMPAKKPLLDRVLATILADPGHPFYSRAKALEAKI